MVDENFFANKVFFIIFTFSDIPQISNTTVDDTYENFWDCFQLVPRYLIAIVDCIYYRNFLSCPTYNDTIFMCPEWRNFVQDCLIDMTE